MTKTTHNMPLPDSDHRPGPAAPNPAAAKSETRIDQPHLISNAAKSDPISAEIIGRALGDIPDDDDSASQGMAIQAQADELAVYLNARLKEIDQRKSLLNARSAQLDASRRTAQATLNERQVELAQREQELTDRERELENRPEPRLPSPAASENSSFELSTKRLARREAALATVQEELDRVHSQALEMCAAAEYLWGEMSSAADQATLADALNRMRNVTARHRQVWNEELAEKKRRLENVRRQLAEENDRLQKHEKELHQWAQQQDLALQHRAAQIASQEAERSREQSPTDTLA